MKVEKTKLKNGAQIIGVHMPGIKEVMISFGFRVGSRSENENEAGISHFLEHMVFKGSKNRPTAELIAKEADRIGAYYNAMTGKEFTLYYMKTALDNFDLALDIVGDMVTRPLLSEEELKKEKGAVIEEIKRSEDNPEFNVVDRIESVLFGDNGMGKLIIGNVKSIRATDAKKMRRYYNKYYVGENCKVVIAGNLPKNWQSKVKKYAGILPSGKKNIQKKVSFNSKNIEAGYKETGQYSIGLAVPGFSVTEKDRYPYIVVAKILGGFMSSRLFSEIREKRGWAYRIQTFTEEGTDNGYMGVYGGIKKGKAEEALTIIRKEILSFSETVTDEEIERAVGNIKGESILRYDNPEETSNFVMQYALYADKIVLPDEMIKEISKVTKKEVIRVAKELFKEENIYVTVIGPFKDKKKFAKILKSRT